jgi:hypothetical protein
MGKMLIKYWPLLCLLLGVICIVSLIFWPSISSWIARVVMCISIGMIILMVVQKHVDQYHKKQIDRNQLARNLVIGISGALLITIVSILAAEKTVNYAIQFVKRMAEPVWPGKGNIVGVYGGLLIAVLVGLGLGTLIRWIWGLLTRPKKITPAKSVS